MKTKNLFSVCSILIVLSLFLFSCTTSKRGAVACPEISLKKSRYSVSHKKSASKTFAVINTKNKSRNTRKHKENHNNTVLNTPELAYRTETFNSEFDRTDYTRGLIASANNMIYQSDIVEIKKNAENKISRSLQDESHKTDSKPSGFSDQNCDTIYLKSGGTYIGKVEEIGQSEIKYRKCNNLSGPVISVLKSDVSAIRYTNGTMDHFGPTETPMPAQPAYPPVNASQEKTEGLAIAGFVSSIVGLFVAGVLLGILGIVFGGVSLSKIKKSPMRYRGKGLAIAAIIIGIVSVVGAIIVLGVI